MGRVVVRAVYVGPFGGRGCEGLSRIVAISIEIS